MNKAAWSPGSGELDFYGRRLAEPVGGASFAAVHITPTAAAYVRAFYCPLAWDSPYWIDLEPPAEPFLV